MNTERERAREGLRYGKDELSMEDDFIKNIAKNIE